MTVNLLYIARMEQYTGGDASAIASLQMMTVKMKMVSVIKMMMVRQYF
nr:MAG TPA: hypothetical protein [Caudoviricetes sp.]